MQGFIRRLAMYQQRKLKRRRSDTAFRIGLAHTLRLEAATPCCPTPLLGPLAQPRFRLFSRWK